MMTEIQYWYFKSALTPEQCQQIIDAGESKIQERKEQGLSTFGNTHGDAQKQALPNAKSLGDKTVQEVAEEQGIAPEEVIKKNYVRDSEIAFLEDTWIYDMIWPYLIEANKQAGWLYDIEWGESVQYTTYNPGGFYGWHNDGAGCHNTKFKRFIKGVSPEKVNGEMQWGYTNFENYIGRVRKLSMTINLNKPGEYEGGNLKFDYGPHANGERYHECDEIRPQGSIIIFPSYVYHQVTPIITGRRKSLVMWALGQPFK